MKAGNFIKNWSIVLLFVVTILNMAAMEKAGKNELTINDIKDKYLVITMLAGVPAWIRIKNNNGQVYVEQQRKKPIVPKAKPDIQSLYENSKFEDRILVSTSEPLLIPYAQVEYPLRIRVWSATNKDNEKDNSNALAFLLHESEVNTIRDGSKKIGLWSLPTFMGGNPNEEVKKEIHSLGGPDMAAIKSGNAKILINSSVKEKIEKERKERLESEEGEKQLQRLLTRPESQQQDIAIKQLRELGRK